MDSINLTNPYWKQFGEINPIVHILGILVFILIITIGSKGNITIVMFHLKYIKKKSFKKLIQLI
jgi:hypothetical protein